MGGCCRNIRCGGEFEEDDDFYYDPELTYRETHMSYKPGYQESREDFDAEDSKYIGKHNNNTNNRNSKNQSKRTSSILGKQRVNSEMSVGGGKRKTMSSRQSVAVVECPLPSLMGKNSEENNSSYNIDGTKNRESSMSLTRGPRMSCSVKPPVIGVGGQNSNNANSQQPQNIQITRNVSVSALEVCPASPEREKLIEIYVITTHSITKAESLPHLSQYFQNVERDAIAIIANEEDGDFTEKNKNTKKKESKSSIFRFVFYSFVPLLKI